MNHNLQAPKKSLFVFWAFVSLVSLVGAGVAPQTKLATPLTMQTQDPVPYFAVTWSATGRGFSDTTAANGTRTVKNRKVTMAGSAVVRQWADGRQDDFPFDLTVTDDTDQLDTSPTCYPGSTRDHTVGSISDPSRYSGSIDWSPSILPPLQRPDGSWYMLDPFVGFIHGRFFTYKFDNDYVNCGGDSSTGTFSMEMGNYASLMLPGDLEGDAQGNLFTKTTQFQAIGDPPLIVQWTVTARRLLGRDLTVDRLEITQGLQDEANTIPLVQGRRTVVRAFIGVGSDQVPIPGVTAKLSGYVGSTLLGTVPPFNPNGRITVPYTPDWRQIDHTLNFELPFAWTQQPTLRLEVEVNPDHSVTELNYNNNKLDTLMTFLPCGGVNVTYSPIHYTPPDGYSPADPSANIKVGQEFMRKIYPVPDKQLVYFPRREVSLTVGINITGTDTLVLKGLQAELLSSSAPRAEHIYGWLPSLAYTDNGLGYTPGVAAFGNDTENPNRWRRTFAHELGHNYGLYHLDMTTAGRHWFDVYDRVIKPVPASVGGKDLLDVMVPDRLEPEAWISPQNYEYLVGQICSGGVGAAPFKTKAPKAGDNLLVTGILSNTTPAAGSLDPLFRYSTVPTHTLPVGVQYCVNLKNAANTILSQSCFNQSFSIDSSTPVSAMPFSIVVPYPAGLNRVELTKGGSVLSSRIASSNLPTVTVTFPNAAGLTLSGAQNVTWTGSDPNGDALTFNILYSRDNGATWMGVGSLITGNIYNLNFSGLPGTTGASGRIKVMVSDGFFSAEDISDNPFTVGNKPPSAVITSPTSGVVFTTGPKIVLQGMGLDLEDGSLGDSTLSWVSSKDGALGTGKLLETSLAPGAHTITLTVTDSGGLTSVASIQVTVNQTATANNLFLPLINKGQ